MSGMINRAEDAQYNCFSSYALSNCRPRDRPSICACASSNQLTYSIPRSDHIDRVWSIAEHIAYFRSDVRAARAMSKDMSYP